MKTTRNGNTLTVTSSDRMSNSGWRRCGCPTWWARIGSGDDARFLEISRVAGDEYLRAYLDIPIHPTEEQELTIGCGKGRDGIRETLRIRSAATRAADAAANAARAEAATR